MSKERYTLKPEDSPSTQHRKNEEKQLSLQPELSLMPEREPTRPGLVILIAGNPGTGTTTLAQELGAYLQQPSITIKSRGSQFREKVSQPVIGFVERDPRIDRRIDANTARSIRRTKPGQVKIIEARLAAVIGIFEKIKALKNGKDFPNIFTILLHAPENVRAERIHARYRGNPNFDVTLKQVQLLTGHRVAGDLAWFLKLYPHLQGIDPVDPNDPWVVANYDVILDSNEYTLDEEVRYILEELLDRKLLPAKGPFATEQSKRFKKHTKASMKTQSFPQS